MMRALGLAMLATSLCAGLPTRAVAGPVPTLPPYTAAYQPQGVDERGIWMLADEEERLLRDSSIVIADARLTHYVHDVLCRIVGSPRCEGARIYVVRDAAFNASMGPNGTLIVNSGLLLRARNEAELASVLGHEFAHFELRHSLLDFKRRRTSGDIVAWAGVAAAGAVAYGGSYRTVRDFQTIQVGAIGSVYAHRREQDTEADLLSMAYLRASPYDPMCFSQVWERVMGEADATARGRKQRSTRYDRVAFFATHPTDLDRATYLRRIAASLAKAGDQGEQAYRDGMAQWSTLFLADQIKLNDFEGTDFLIAAIAGDRWSADLLFARGELYRARGNPRDLVAAIGFYRAAIEREPGNAEAYRGIGLAQLRSHDPSAADALKTYLTMKPDAPDKAMISTLLL